VARRRITLAVTVVVIASVAAFVLQGLVEGDASGWASKYGVISAVMMHGDGVAANRPTEPWVLTLFTAPFLHAGLGHLALRLSMACFASRGPLFERKAGCCSAIQGGRAGWRSSTLWGVGCTDGYLGRFGVGATLLVRWGVVRRRPSL